MHKGVFIQKTEQFTTENPKLYLPLRENLIKKVTEWVNNSFNTVEGQPNP